MVGADLSGCSRIAKRALIAAGNRCATQINRDSDNLSKPAPSCQYFRNTPITRP